MRALTIQIDGIRCENCAARLQSLLRREPGVRAASVSFAGQFAHLTFVPRATNETELAHLIASAGFTVVISGS